MFLKAGRIGSIEEFIAYIRRKLGAPLIKVELTDDQIIDCISEAIELFVKEAAGQATEPMYMTVMLSGGQTEYELPEGVIDVLDFDDEGYGDTGINTLFTIENQLYNAGILDFTNLSMGTTLISYHMTLDFIKVLQRYTTTGFTWNYDQTERILTIDPAPKDDTVWLTDPETGKKKPVNSPGFLLLKLKGLIGAGRKGFNIDKAYVEMFNRSWVREYSLACARETLGYVRKKFDSFASVGNTGINLDGDSLVSEGKAEKESLLERLSTKECWEGYGIITGIV